MISGYDTSYRGEILVSTFTAGMHPINPMAGHILPVIFNGHLGVQLQRRGDAGKGGLDPDEFWHAWARGRDMTVDIFDSDWSVWDWIERDLEELRRDWNVRRRAVPRSSGTAGLRGPPHYPRHMSGSGAPRGDETQTTGLAPPSTLMATPVMNEPASEHRKQAMRANSSALPMRPSGMRPLAMPARNSS